MAFSVQQHYGPDAFVGLEPLHKDLCGAWKFEGKIWPYYPEDTANDPTTQLDTTGTAEISLTADGRYFHLNWSGESSNDRWAGGCIIGYAAGLADANGKRTMNESFYNSYGSFGSSKASYKKGDNRLEMAGEVECYDRNSKEKYRHILNIKGKNRFEMEVHLTAHGGKESKVRHLIFSRV
ncbi:Protein of unknown function [Rhizobium tibeticum]|uniref:THAP4-like heme-binding beta-barrel domain-containing protein n=1 Tax=Rhizobium tibeticum TaxID=501024 RepID=A0A1H8WDM5_9HYPH|nr:DUF1579 family protein [Rhizobium tibeticum]SEI20854.1 hypothetical protein RTCCBAU85039_6488 [Rhizobium tibeticum]SEP25736.1 Protein of unknown function [Rhizobium tibeticum]